MLQPGSSATVFLLWATAIVITITVVLTWPKLAGRGLGVILGRLVVQMTASALVVLAVAGTLNQQNGWYTSWTDLSHDLLGTSPPAQRQVLKGSLQLTSKRTELAINRENAQYQLRFGTERLSFAQGAHLHEGFVPSGQYIHTTIPGLGSALGHGAGRVLIWLPPSYTRGSQQTTYPVIEAFAGDPGSPRDYSHYMKLQNIITAAHRNAGLVEPIVVMPDYLPSGIDTECTNSPGVAMDTWVNDLVPNWVEHHLRVRPDRASWAAMGYSAGAFCAEVSAFLHPKRFSAVMLFGTYDHPLWSDWKPYHPANSYPAKYDMQNVIRDHPPRVDVWIEVSGGDPFSSPPSERLIRDVRSPTSVTAVYLPGAGHRFAVWKAAMPGAMKWLAQSVHGFAGSGHTRATRLNHRSHSVFAAGREQLHHPA